MMATDQLSASSGSGTQGSTQSPQSAGSTATGAPTSSVQPGTATALLNNGQGGVPLHGTALSTVNLAPATAAATVTVQPPLPGMPAKHHINTPLFGMAILLFVVAAVLFWTTGRSVKNTT
jgi:hypothetical protein